MISLTFYGLDQFVVGQLSNEMGVSLANLYEVSEDDILFICPECCVYHKGIDQTSWNVIVNIEAPKKVQVLQDDVMSYVKSMLNGIATNVFIRFSYYSQDDVYEFIDETYPRFLEQSNIVDFDDEDEHDHDHDEDIFSGDIFKDFNKKD